METTSKRTKPGGMCPVREQGRRWAVLGLTALAAIAAPACLGQSVATDSVTYATPWAESSPSEFTVYLRQLNTNVADIGTVLGIELRMFATNLADITLENWDPNWSNDVRVTVSSTAHGSNGEHDLALSMWHTYYNLLAMTNPAPNTGTNWTGPDTVFMDNLQVSGASSNLITAGFASLYFGSGSFEYSVDSDASFGQSGTPLVASYADLRSVGVAEEIYTYAMVPEPGPLIPAAVMASLALIVVWRRGRRKSRHGDVGGVRYGAQI